LYKFYDYRMFQVSRLVRVKIWDMEPHLKSILLVLAHTLIPEES